MHIQVYDSAQTVAIGLIGSTPPAVAITSPWIRPRLEGQRSVLRGEAFSAIMADNARVLFTVRLPSTGADVLNNYIANLTVFQAPLLGQDPQASYPVLTKNVSGFFAVDGQIVVDVSMYGVNRVQLEILRVVDPPGVPKVESLYVQTQILAEERAIDVESYMHDRGET